MTLTPADRLSTEHCVKVGKRWAPVCEVQTHGTNPVLVRAGGETLQFPPTELVPTKPRPARAEAAA